MSFNTTGVDYPACEYPIRFRLDGSPRGRMVTRSFPLEQIPDEITVRGKRFVRENLIKHRWVEAPRLAPIHNFSFTSQTLPPRYKYALEAGCTTDSKGRVQFDNQRQHDEMMRRAKAAGEGLVWNDGLDADLDD